MSIELPPEPDPTQDTREAILLNQFPPDTVHQLLHGDPAAAARKATTRPPQLTGDDMDTTRDTHHPADTPKPAQALSEPLTAPVFHQIDPGRQALYKALATAIYWTIAIGFLTWAFWIGGVI